MTSVNRQWARLLLERCFKRRGRKFLLERYSKRRADKNRARANLWRLAA
jgi:hypothetical protein